MDLIQLRSNMDGTNCARKSKMVFYIFIINGTVSKRGCRWRQYMDILRLRCIMDVPRHHFEMELYILIKFRSVSKRYRIWRRKHHLDLHQLRCHLGPAFHRHQNQRIHPHQVVRIGTISTRDIRSRGGHERTTLRLIRLRTDVDAETRSLDVVGGVGVGYGGGDDGDGTDSSNSHKTK